jgi:hypothetical protein
MQELLGRLKTKGKKKPDEIIRFFWVVTIYRLGDFKCLEVNF